MSDVKGLFVQLHIFLVSLFVFYFILSPFCEIMQMMWWKEK